MGIDNIHLLQTDDVSRPEVRKKSAAKEQVGQPDRDRVRDGGEEAHGALPDAAGEEGSGA